MQLSPGQVWELQDGDVIAFGGPETIVAQRSHVTNPFVFKYSSHLEEQAVGLPLPTEDEDVPGPSNDVQAQVVTCNQLNKSQFVSHCSLNCKLCCIHV